jgi:hypothetical protein
MSATLLFTEVLLYQTRSLRVLSFYVPLLAVLYDTSATLTAYMKETNANSMLSSKNRG